LYEQPATEFVHDFIGPTTVFKGVSVRPHDIELVPSSKGDIEGTVQSIMELGIEVQDTVALCDGSVPWIQLSRN